jgi:hypothetical protein
MFKTGQRHPDTHRVEVWWVWDGEREWRVDELDEEQQRYSVLGIVSHPFLVERIESGWHPEQWGDWPGLSGPRASPGVTVPPGRHVARFVLLVPWEEVAWSVSDRLVPDGFEVDVDREPGGSRWIACARRPLDSLHSLELLDAEMERLAEGVGGEYDGHEVDLNAR